MNLNHYDVIVINHSGGKDSQAMLSHIWSSYPEQRHKLVVVHADLGEMEWEPMHSFIEANSFGLPVHVVKPQLDFFELCRKYKRLPSGQARFCTDQLKTAPINGWIKKQYAGQRVLNCIGIRAEESPARAKKPQVSPAKGSTKATPITNWFPIFDYKLGDVWQAIEAVGQKPHQVYSKGFSRLSCVFCVFGRIGEHTEAAKLKPELAQRMANLEIELGKSIRLKQVAGVKLPKYMGEYIPSVQGKNIA